MSTRSTINLQTTEGMIKSIYCHFDGYPLHHMTILTNYYNTYEKVEELINLGDLSVLDISIEKPKGHSFETPIKGYCIAYGRDRGEDNVDYCIHHNIDSINKQQYNYLFINNEWKLI
jgi:hypothetical protein